MEDAPGLRPNMGLSTFGVDLVGVVLLLLFTFLKSLKESNCKYPSQ